MIWVALYLVVLALMVGWIAGHWPGLRLLNRQFERIAVTFLDRVTEGLRQLHPEQVAELTIEQRERAADSVLKHAALKSGSPRDLALLDDLGISRELTEVERFGEALGQVARATMLAGESGPEFYVPRGTGPSKPLPPGRITRLPAGLDVDVQVDARALMAKFDDLRALQMKPLTEDWEPN